MLKIIVNNYWITLVRFCVQFHKYLKHSKQADNFDSFGWERLIDTRCYVDVVKSWKKLFQLLRQATFGGLTLRTEIQFARYTRCSLNIAAWNHFQVTILLYVTLRGQELVTKLLTGICAWT